MDAGRKRKIETRGEVAAEEESKKNKDRVLGFHCNYCKRDVSDQMYIKSAVSEDVDLCLECFSVGVEILDVNKTDGKNVHRNDTKYRVMERLDFPIVTENWTAREELALLDGIETYGIGNWAEIEKNVGTKTKPECEFHYYAHYINNKSGATGFPVPDVSKAKSKTHFEGTGRPDDFSECVEAAVAGAGPIPGKLTKSEWKKHMSETKHITRETIRYYDDKPPGSDVVGYMPSRGDFDVEWDNEAERLICDCVFDEKKDTDQDRDLKNKVLEIYNWKLEERQRRKDFILQRGLLDYKKQQSQDRRRTKDERELWSQMRLFARFWPQEEHEEFMRGLTLERKIRKRIEQLQQYRKVGLHTFAESDAYEIQKRDKELAEKQQRKMKQETSAYLIPKATTSQRTERSRNRGEDIEMAELGGGTSKEPNKLGAFDVISMQGVELLSAGERTLCAQNRVTPLEYLSAKDVVVRESLRLGYVQRARALEVMPKVLEPAQAAKVYDFLTSAFPFLLRPPLTGLSFQ